MGALFVFAALERLAQAKGAAGALGEALCQRQPRHWFVQSPRTEQKTLLALAFTTSSGRLGACYRRSHSIHIYVIPVLHAHCEN